jgi:serine/threonine-protein kinase
MIKAGHKLGKYRIERNLSRSAFAAVYRAYDTIEGKRVALKLPHAQLASTQFLEEFRKEVRLAARLDHAHILPVKNASFIDKQFVIVMPLGERTLADRLRSRMSLERVLDYAEQMLVAVAHAHERHVIHCDIKPENIILFNGTQLRLADFGIARLAQRTVRASGSGTLGFLAPEQAMGRPSYRSDVFSLGLIFYRMLTGRLPEWPFDWPPPGYERLRRRVPAEMIAFLRRALEVDPAQRYRDAGQMLAAFQRIKLSLQRQTRARRRSNGTGAPDWREVRHKQFQQRYRRVLDTHDECPRCHGPVSEAMPGCPWCGKSLQVYGGETRFPSHCPRCRRGAKLDWNYCAWCYGEGRHDASARHYTDHRYTARCASARCSRRDLMPWMRYCPWCHAKVRQRWKIPDVKTKCDGCGWGVVREFWSHCPWCVKPLTRARAR